jgi:hypothetical protein
MLDGLPLLKPPYGRVTAIDLSKGDTKWVAAIGDGPRSHPLLKDLNLPALGAPIRNAAMVTKTLLFVAMGAGNLGGGSNLPVGGRPMSKVQIEPTKFRVYDKATGAPLVGHGRAGAPARVTDDVHAPGKAVHCGRRRQWTQRRTNRVRLGIVGSCGLAGYGLDGQRARGRRAYGKYICAN